MKSFFNVTLSSPQKVMGLLSFGFCRNSVNSINVVAEIQLKLLNERALSTGEPCTCEDFTSKAIEICL